MNDDMTISAAMRQALASVDTYARTQHELLKTIPIEPVSLSRGKVEVDITIPERFGDEDGVHGGFFTIMLDTVLATAAWSRMEKFEPLATINLRTDFFLPAHPGEVVRLTATCAAVEDQIAFCQGRVERDGTAIAQADGTFIVGTSRSEAKSRL